MMKIISYTIALTILGIIPQNSIASSSGLTGFVAIEQRAFFKAPKHSGQEMGNLPSFIIEPEYYFVSENEQNILTFKPFFRYDQEDNERTYFDIRQLDWIHAGAGWELKAGISKVFWGVTEHNHLVDIINQTDTLDGSDGEDKLGQPMIKLGLEREWGNMQLFYLPYFRERRFAGKEGRLRTSILVDEDLTNYESGAKEWQPSFAARYSHYFGNWDIGFSHFYGTSREPRLTQTVNIAGETVFSPTYDIINQTGADIQYTSNGWLWKLETISRKSDQERFFAAAGGLEYTLFGILDTDIDLGILTEYSRDDRGGISDSPGTQLDDDIFVGARLLLNNSQDSQMLAGILVDRNTKARSISFEASHRLSKNWVAEVDFRASYNLGSEPIVSDRSRDNFAQIRLSRYF